MAKVEGLNRRGSRFSVRIVIPMDLHEVYGKSRVNIALGTSDLREATLLGTIRRAEWLAEFEAKRCELAPAAVDAVTPELAALLAERVRAFVLADDDRVRSALPLLAEMVHVRRELSRLKANRLRIPQWEPTEPRIDDLTGATDEERRELADLNAYLDGKAAIALAGGNLAAVLPLAQAEAAKLGVSFDARTPGARAALAACLKTYRTAHREVTLRDAGDVVDTPMALTTPAAVKPGKARTLRDVYNRWKASGESPRSADTIAVYERSLKQFEGQHPSLSLNAITRDVGDTYRTFLRETPLASKC